MRIGFNIYPLQSGHKKRGIGYYTKNLLDNLRKDNRVDIVEFNKISEVKNVDIVHYPWFDLYFHTLPIRKKFPTVVTIHDVIPVIFRKYYPVGTRAKVNFLLQKISLKNCKAYITDSNNSKKDIVKYLRLDKSKVFAIPLATDEGFKILSDTKLLRIRRKFNLPDRYLLYVGDANWVKNIPFLIRSFNKLIRSASTLNDLKLILVGEIFLKNVDNIDHPELESLKLVNKLIEELDLKEKVRKIGNLEIEELVAIYNLACVYVQPSFYEGFGLPILEAFNCGTPVVSSRGGSLPEIGGDAVLYFDPTREDQLIKLLLEVIQNKSLREKLIKLGVRVAEKFSWKKTADNTINIYQQILNHSR